MYLTPSFWCGETMKSSLKLDLQAFWSLKLVILSGEFASELKNNPYNNNVIVLCLWISQRVPTLGKMECPNPGINGKSFVTDGLSFLPTPRMHLWSCHLWAGECTHTKIILSCLYFNVFFLQSFMWWLYKSIAEWSKKKSLSTCSNASLCMSVYVMWSEILVWERMKQKFLCNKTSVVVGTFLHLKQTLSRRRKGENHHRNLSH